MGMIYPFTIPARSKRGAAVTHTPIRKDSILTLSTPDGRDWHGTPDQIVSEMHERSLERGAPREVFLEACARRAEQLGEKLTIEGATDAERAASLLSGYVRLGWARVWSQL